MTKVGGLTVKLTALEVAPPGFRTVTETGPTVARSAVATVAEICVAVAEPAAGSAVLFQ
jgi:hypothetical protein